MQADPDPGLLATLLPLLCPLSHLCRHPLWHPCQLQTRSCTPWWVNIDILLLFIFSLPRELSRALLLWESKQRWCSKGKGEQSPQVWSTSQADNTNFEMRLVGEGWKERWPIFSSNWHLLRVDPEKAGMPPNRRVTTVVKGKNIGMSFLVVQTVLGKIRFCKVDMYRIRGHVWVHGSIGYCHPASIVAKSVKISTNQFFLPKKLAPKTRDLWHF